MWQIARINPFSGVLHGQAQERAHRDQPHRDRSLEEFAKAPFHEALHAPAKNT